MDRARVLVCLNRKLLDSVLPALAADLGYEFWAGSEGRVYFLAGDGMSWPTMITVDDLT